MMYVCLGCYKQQETITVELQVPTYDAPGGSVDSIDIETVEYSPLLNGLCVNCHTKKHFDSDDDHLPF